MPEPPDDLLIGELFAGYGGLGLGVQAVLGGRVAWVAEIDAAPSLILKTRLPGVLNLGDVTAIDWANVLPVDVLALGFPCQDVSNAGAQAGLLHGTRSGLWHEAVRAIDVLRPQLVVIENVRGLLSAKGDVSAEYDDAQARLELVDNLLAHAENALAIARHHGRTVHAQRAIDRTHRLLGSRRRAMARLRRAERRIVRAIGTVLGSLAGLGFDAEWVGLPASDVGAPHKRFRVFILAWPADAPRDSGWVGHRDRWPVADVADADRFGLQGLDVHAPAGGPGPRAT